MKLLSIDTSTKNFSLAVSDGDKILNYRNVKLNKVLSSSIIPCIQKILGKSGLSLKQLDGFAVGLGPGSFTSLRVGLSTVKGLAFAASKPVVGISSLDVLALNVKKEAAQVCTVCDARRGLVYSCVYQKKGRKLKRTSPYLLTNIDNVLGKVKGEAVFIGDGIKLYRDAIAKKNKAQFINETKWFPQARCLAQLALERFDGKNKDNLVPLYLYPQDCQVKK